MLLHSFTDIGGFLVANPTINRVILEQVDRETWKINQQDAKRPNDLEKIAKLSKGQFGYEQSSILGFETLSGYDIITDKRYRVVYRLGD